MQVLVTVLVGLAWANPPVPEPTFAPELLELSTDARDHIHAHLSTMAGRPLFVHSTIFGSEADALARKAQIEQESPGRDLLFYLVDSNADGWPDLLQMSAQVDAASVLDDLQAIRRPLLIDTNADGVADRIAPSGGVRGLGQRRVAQR